MLYISELKTRLPKTLTAVQFAEEVKKLRETEVEISYTKVYNIIEDNSSYLPEGSLILEIGSDFYSDNGNYFLDKDEEIKIISSNSYINDNLKKYNKGEKVTIQAKLVSATLGVHHFFILELKSIKPYKDLSEPQNTKIERDYESLIYGCGSLIALIFAIYFLLTLTENGYWFHDVLGPWVAKAAILLTFVMSSFFFYYYFTNAKSKNK